MTTKSSFQKIARKCSGVRALGLRHLATVRKERSDANWAYVHSVLSSIGTLMMSWGLIERQINTLICQYHYIAPEKLRRKGLPSSLGEKINYLVAIAKDERLPISLRSSIQEWIPAIGRLRSHRDWIVHGNLAQVGRSLRWRAQLLTLRGDEPAFEDRYFTNDELQAKVREIGVLSHQMAEVLTPILLRTASAK
jgi:hypothetical protein